jgi:hypothetical protein
MCRCVCRCHYEKNIELQHKIKIFTATFIGFSFHLINYHMHVYNLEDALHISHSCGCPYESPVKSAASWCPCQSTVRHVYHLWNLQTHAGKYHWVCAICSRGKLQNDTLRRYTTHYLHLILLKGKFKVKFSLCLNKDQAMKHLTLLGLLNQETCDGRNV